MQQTLNPTEISELIRKRVEQFDVVSEARTEGTIVSVSDGICRVHGLADAMQGEMIEFPGDTYGLALNLERDSVGIVIIGDYEHLSEGDTARCTGKILQVPVGEGLLGRVVNALGAPIDGAGPIDATGSEPIEKIAPGVITRQSVSQPVQTGLKSIDAMVPVGRGQRELIIGDRQTGKTAVAIDAIINQKEYYDKGEPVYCIYVAVGQKGSTVAQVAATLEKYGALDYTVIVAANASDPAALQFYAPMAGAAIGEYFRDTGRHALVIYDDLSKQAVSYREVSLLLRRPPGREAYPGDVFYLHSRLLERAAKIIDDPKVASQMNNLPEPLQDEVEGGGSLTALPVIETQAGDVSAYIPTNVISITDGQIYLETELFFSGVRPAVNVGISVSRVGGSAQVKSMKKLSGTLKLDLAQYRELEAFAKFGSDLDAATQRQLKRGERTVELMKQGEYNPLPVEQQIALLKINNSGLLDKLPVDKIREFEDTYLDMIGAKYSKKMEELSKSGKLSDEFGDEIVEAAQTVVDQILAAEEVE